MSLQKINLDTQPWVVSGKIQDGKLKPEKIGHPTTTEPVRIEDKEPVDDNENDILEKLKSTIEKINEMISEGAEITKQQLIDWGKTLKDIAVGVSESKTIYYKRKEENVEDSDEEDVDEEDADEIDADERDIDEDDADEEYGKDYDHPAK